MIDDTLRNEIAAAVCGTGPGILASCVRVLGIEAINKERWRAWLRPHGSQQVLLLLVSLRSNCYGREFDLLPCLSIACWRPLHAVPASVPTRQATQLVGVFDRQTGRSGRRRCEEIGVAQLPLPFCDPWDQLWVFSGPVGVGQSPTPAGTVMAWLHADALFLAVGWHSSLSPALAASEARGSTTSLLSLQGAKKRKA